MLIFPEADEISLLTRCIFYLHGVSNEIDIKGKQEQGIQRIVASLKNYVYNSSNDSNYRVTCKSLIYPFLSAMITNTLSSGNDWFAKVFRDYFGSPFTSIEFLPLNYFYLVYCFYLSRLSKILNPESKKTIDDLTHKAPTNQYSDESSWVSNFAHKLDLMDEMGAIHLLKSLMDIYGSDDATYYVYQPKESGVYPSYKNEVFYKYHLFDAWFELVIYGPVHRISLSKMKSLVYSLSVDEQRAFIDRLSSKWIDSGGKLKNACKETSFLQYIGCITPNELMNPHVNNVEVLFRLRNSYNERKTTLKSKKAKSTKNYVKIKEKLFQICSHAFDNHCLVNNTTSFDFDKNAIFTLTVSNVSSKNVLKMLQEEAPSYMGQRIKEEMIQEIRQRSSTNNYISSNTYAFPNKIIEQIYKFKPTFMSRGSYLEYSQDKRSKRIQKIDGVCFPQNLYWKGDALSINIKLDEKNTDYRGLTKEEINQIIDNEYTMINGLYKYTEYKGDDIHSFLVNRGKLVDLLTQTLDFVIISYNYKFSIDEKNIFYVDTKSQ
ncbi:MAG: hypothetical protein WC196_02195 [Bacilli bacterium]